LNELGFDPILNMPDFEVFATGVGKRKVSLLWGDFDDRYPLKLFY
jgi:hypothetical protein